MAYTIQDVFEAFNSYMRFSTNFPLELTLAVAVGNQFKHEQQVSLMLVGPPSSGKTEILMGLDQFNKAIFISSVTTNTFLSGFVAGKKDRRGDKSLLFRMANSGKNIIVIKDLTTILSMHPNVRDDIFSQIREVLDGRMSREFGTGERVDWRGKIGIISAVTPIIHEYRNFIALMGERFIYYEINYEDVPGDAVYFSLVNCNTDNRKRYIDVTSCFLNELTEQDIEDPIVRESHIQAIADLAKTLALMRGVVRRDHKHEVMGEPIVESPTRVANQMRFVLKALATLYGESVTRDEDVVKLKRLTKGNIPRNRLNILLAFEKSEAYTYTEIAEALSVKHTSSLYYKLQDMVLLELLCFDGKYYTVHPTIRSVLNTTGLLLDEFV